MFIKKYKLEMTGNEEIGNWLKKSKEHPKLIRWYKKGNKRRSS